MKGRAYVRDALLPDAWGGRCGGAAALMVALLGLTACGTTLQDQSGGTAKAATAAAAPASPKTETAAAPPVPASTTAYVVQRGDTLYGLSRRTGATVARLASINDLPPPYLLKTGQTLRLPGAAAPPAPNGTMTASLPALPGATAPVPAAAPRAAVTQAALPAPAPPSSSGKAADLARPDAVKDAPSKPAVPARPAAEPYVVPSLAAAPGAATVRAAEPNIGTSPALPAAAPLPAPPARSTAGFMMPVQGKVIAGFGPQGGGLHNDGINIAAARGTPVKAAEHGVVVYAGNEVRGFGNMLLVQHEAGFVTAYAHLDSMTVQRGSRITRGQKIGTVGMTGNVTAPQLHFEIRQGKQALDPEKQMAASSPRTAMIGQLR